MSNRFFPNYDDYKITSRYGMRTLNGETKMHSGIDLVAKTSAGKSAADYIMAHTGGVVSDVGYDESAGNYVKIKVADNTTMVYYHLKATCSLKKGAAVKRGDKLGYMGSTGNSTGAHLHWGIKYNGEWIDPAPYLDRDYAEPCKTVNVELPVLKRGLKSESVKTLQFLLLANGYGVGTSGADGSFGAKTEAALKSYQADHGLEADGSCGKKTWAKVVNG